MPFKGIPPFSGAVKGTTGDFSGDVTIGGTVQAGLETETKTGDVALAADDCRGQIIYVTATGTITLPAVADCVEGASVTIYSTTAATIHIDPDSADRIRLDGTALADGYKITSEGSAGDHITLSKDSADGWTTFGKSGNWTNGG